MHQYGFSKTIEILETRSEEFEAIDIDKFCGIAALFQNSDVSTNCRLLLQLHTNWLPFYVEAGGAPTLFVFLNEEKNEGILLIEDM